ncbi:TPA: hypothetical protein N0F65_004170 [Lagenidium giganteum]|uniref:Cyclic nucleotide-binding domain-containing protein n=1 Tax=Lagenidium giganteum TaxID=4803 RepID=A0AAV2ZF79_9STRA|nr:TPA: hypothetical protein N0F65_004170 [Lagenidium giganteum]
MKQPKQRVQDGDGGDGDTHDDTEKNEYGLKDLARLPMLEQVHRLFHAIKKNYPYKETNAWKSLPLDQKKAMLEYIRTKRSQRSTETVAPSSATKRRAASATASATATAAKASSADEAASKAAAAPPAVAAQRDPYLQMLQKRSIRTIPTTHAAAAGSSHPNTSYVGAAEVAQYAETLNKKKVRARWKVIDAEFYDQPCACGQKHQPRDGAKALLFNTVRAMMNTFGDCSQPCATAVDEVQSTVGKHIRKQLGTSKPNEVMESTCLRALVEIFSEEAVYYGRWREFRGETKHEASELEDVEEEELAEELDLFAVDEANEVFNDAFLERIKFADDRTKGMDWSIYDMFAKGRKVNFMHNKGLQFRQWLRLGQCSRASLEFMNFVAYHNIGLLVEQAIKNRTGGTLQLQEKPLFVADIISATSALSPKPALKKTESIDPDEDASTPPSKKARTLSDDRTQQTAEILSKREKIESTDDAVPRVEARLVAVTEAISAKSGIVEDDDYPNDSDQVGDLDIRTSSMTSQSPFMVRQAERAHFTSLSPIEEMRLVQNELRAKAASQLTSEKALLHQSFHSLITTRDVLKKLKNRSFFKVRPNEGSVNIAADERPLACDMDELTPAEALKFVETVSKKEIMMVRKQIEYEESNLPPYIISPHGKFRLRWDVLSVLLISYNAVLIPFQISFGETDDGLENFQRFVDAFCISDIVVNFVSAYEENGRIHADVRTIARRYLRTWFIFDLVSSFPIYVNPSNYSRVPQLTRLFRLFRLLRLFRMLAILRILNRLEYALLLRSTVSSLVKFTFLVCFTSHWLSCFFFLISADDDEGWVAKMHMIDQSVYAKYVTAFYWAIMTMTTVGFGDVHPWTTNERVFAIGAMVIGAWIFAYGITNVVAMVANLNAADTQFQLKMDELNDYMEARELPVQLRYEIREFFFNARVSAESKLMNEGKILAELSALLRSKIAFAINDTMLNKMPFFIGADHNFLMELALSMRMVCFPPMEEVILEGEIGEEMFFIFRGVVEVLKGDVQLGLLTEKQYFGEMAILNQNCLRTATVRTLCFCELRMLTREKFLIALSHFPSMKQRIARIVEKRTKRGPGQPTAPPSTSSSTRKDSLRHVEMVSGLDKMAASLADHMDAETVKEITTPTPETTLNRISQLNSNYSSSLRSIAVETDVDRIQTRMHTVLQQQERLASLMDSIEDNIRELAQRKQRQPGFGPT